MKIIRPLKVKTYRNIFNMLNTINYGAMYNKYNTLIYADDKTRQLKH
ncbi:hypothetical protein QWY90_00005 [Flavobacterium paronense]|nr:hypothetical protein [Flavobacterium paronense]MDN3675754.1 hypothetical protein [Flavobacterium paronense]